MSAAWDPVELAGALRLDSVGEDRFGNPRLSLNMNRQLFGGQFVANTLAAAMLTSTPRVPRAVQGIFVQAGKAEIPLEFAVERLHDGRQLSHRQVRMTQQGRLLFSANVYLEDARADAAPLHQQTAKHLQPSPEQLLDAEVLAERHLERLGPVLHERLVSKKSVLTRPVHPEASLFAPSAEPRLALWLKPAIEVPNEPVLQYAALAFLSDYWLCWPSRTPHVDSIVDPAYRMFSLDHALWFHARPDVGDWLLYEVDSPAAAGGFGLGRGAMFDRSGRLLGSSAQQALLA